MTKSKCFIIMPISTPTDQVLAYGGDQDHFSHVLDYLFIPAIDKAGFEPVPPIAKGSDLIHAEIVKNLESCDFALCDMSSLNANVFFELGIRTAVNKPVALVRDDVTLKVPFDTNIINHHQYLSALNPWTLTKEIDHLASHLENCFSKKEGKNSLWQYFSMSAKAVPIDTDVSEKDKVSYLSMQIDALRKELDRGKTIDHFRPALTNEERHSELWNAFSDMAASYKVRLDGAMTSGNAMRVTVIGEAPAELEDRMRMLANDLGVRLTISVRR